MLSMSARCAMLMTLSVLPTCPNIGYGTAPRLQMATVLTLTRAKAKHGLYIGRLSVNGKFECYTLEDELLAIAPGTYKVTPYQSPKSGNRVLLVHVPGRLWIEIHKGNFKDDSQGCILVGISHTDKSVVASGKAFTHLMKEVVLPCSLVVT